jgi:hypothetical protein
MVRAGLAGGKGCCPAVAAGNIAVVVYATRDGVRLVLQPCEHGDGHGAGGRRNRIRAGECGGDGND